MKLYYTKTWEADISEKDIKNECKPYFNINFLSGTRKQKNSIINIITEHILDKYTPYNFSEVPHAFVKPLKAQIQECLESYPIMIALMMEGEH